MGNFNANNPGDGENPIFSAPNISISDHFSPSDGGGTEIATRPVPEPPTYDKEATGAELHSQEDDDGVVTQTTPEEARPLQSTSTPPSGESPTVSSTTFQYQHPSLPTLHTENDTPNQHYSLGAGPPNPGFSSEPEYQNFEPVPARHKHEGARHDTMVIHRPPSSHDMISAAPVSSEYHNTTSQTGVPIGDLSQAANDSSSGDHMLRTLRGHMSHPDGMLPSAYTSNLQQADHIQTNDQVLPIII